MPAAMTSLVLAASIYKRCLLGGGGSNGRKPGVLLNPMTGLYSASDVVWKERWASSQATSVPTSIQESAPLPLGRDVGSGGGHLWRKGGGWPKASLKLKTVTL